MILENNVMYEYVKDNYMRKFHVLDNAYGLCIDNKYLDGMSINIFLTELLASIDTNVMHLNYYIDKTVILLETMYLCSPQCSNLQLGYNNSVKLSELTTEFRTSKHEDFDINNISDNVVNLMIAQIKYLAVVPNDLAAYSSLDVQSLRDIIDIVPYLNEKQFELFSSEVNVSYFKTYNDAKKLSLEMNVADEGKRIELTKELLMSIIKSFNKEKEKIIMSQTNKLAKESKCSAKQVACMIIGEGGYIISKGVNGSLSKKTNCNDLFKKIDGLWHKKNDETGKFELCEDQEEHHKWSKLNEVHAEINAVSRAAATNISCKGASVYITYSPCRSCAMALIQAQISEVIFENYYDAENSSDMFKDTGILLRSIN